MNGLKNRIIVLDLRGETHQVTPQEARQIHAFEGLAYDQLMILHDSQTKATAAFMRILNNDGSLSAACGNGTRCVASLLFKELGVTSLTLETQAGLLHCVQEGELVRVDMGEPRFNWQDIPLSEAFADTKRIELALGPQDNPLLHSPSVVSMGNPHAVFFVKDVQAFELEKIGPLLEHHPLFPQRANISLVQVNSRTHLTQRVWERGAGITLACGTGACAAAVCAMRLHLCERNVRVSLPGGDLFIAWQENNHVMMTGAVELERVGSFAMVFDHA
jgi:diaminopimelate epimerase